MSDHPTMLGAQRVSDQWSVLASWFPVPGMGGLPVNSFLLKGSEPLLIDTGLSMLGDAFVTALESEIDPEELSWIWVSHMDADHVGNLARVLEIAPKAKVVTNFLGMGKMNLAGLDVSRVHLLNPGDCLELSDRRLRPLRPPYYDAPETIGFFDDRDRMFFAADSFGALLPEPVADLREVADDTLRDGLVGWSSIDAPWLTSVDQATLGRTLKSIERLDPEAVLSGHLPLARKGAGQLTHHVANAYCRGANSDLDPLAIEHIEAAFA
ncbi:MBL fold metallo-hydrolase [Roseibium salinum]|uniref:MBL fold metallo-hydrolase n=1 Tax=Roseibium salinum TaxID=1604349 RepID=A0ABT3QXX0_9HYPH|nr:MBL fold metallo-hydrolase [Roseibium sp. DSM 29163]MCX2721798.1 MBL fold metallo-hydrolase [Roseibium sp. DSM 29163]MDN3720165.1 MBL fold metallo-hydrolase [Roseibium salinum]